ncbi:ComEC/Rec2 family competence protein [Nocardioides pantholopis]|uniref:ComEC/Rec2 family competence protein n=1 Tax=Nocardioides pantholopis TaxID=2483798 RepID=UPI001F154415|nr:ComEC/Rec2 family competence protein [Nocardioides pantholopis]
MRPADEGTPWAQLRARPDLRLPLLGLAAWVGALAAHLLPRGALAGLAAGALLWLVRARRRGSPRVLTVAAMVLVAGAVACSVLVRAEQVATSPLAELARDRAVVSTEAVVTSDPRPVAGRFGEVVLVRLSVREVTGRGATHRLRAAVLVLADEDWLDVQLGARVRATGRLAPADDADLAGVLSASGAPRPVAAPDLWWRGAAAVRASLRESVAHRPEDQRVLVPALVNGDDAGLDPGLAEDFRATGLTHLLAVSGTNLTLVVGFLLVLARWAGVRGRWLYLVGACGIVGFVLLARTEPSVLRAAVMGTVALVAMGSNGLQRGLRGLGAAVLGLLLVQPSLAVAPGFALSVLATAGILVLAPGWRDAMARWLPRWLAEAVAVPAAAQLACTPLVAGISGQVSVVAVVANLVVAPVVGPATVLGLVGGLLGLVAEPAGRVAGTGAAWCVAWIVAVARRGAGLPTAAVEWGTGALSLAVLTLGCVLLAVLAPRLLARRTTGIGCCLVMVLAVLVRPPTPGWPPAGWVVVACAVGQGDALVVRSGPDAAVVVDAGPDPDLVDACLDELGVDRVPLVVLTHFHADHVDGLPGVLAGRAVDAVATGALLDPPAGVAAVESAAAAASVPVAPLAPGVHEVGEVTLQVLRPTDPGVRGGPGDGSTANDASVVLLASVRGVRVLLTGDVEPPAQAALARDWPGLRADVLKLPHHGSRHQDLDWLTSLGARVVLVPVGEDNDYGHPAPAPLAALERAGARVLRTDTDDDLAVTVDGDELGTDARG